MDRPVMQLPWTLHSAPHAVLDILRGCNIQCRACSNTRSTQAKPVDEIEREVEQLMQLRSLDSVSVVGGEPSLHPELVDVVRMLSGKGLKIELFSNGVALDRSLLDQLKEAGVKVVFLHIESDQIRPDLPSGGSAEDLRRLREEKAALVASVGIEVGMAVTVHPDHPEQLEEAVSFVLASEHVVYLLVTMWRDIAGMPLIRGNLENGMFGEISGVRIEDFQDTRSWRDVATSLREHFGLEPFAYLGSNFDAEEPRWLSFLVASLHEKGATGIHRTMRATRIEKLFLATAHRLKGRYPFWQAQNAPRFIVHLLLNGLAGGGFLKNLKIAAGATRRGRTIRAKRLLFQWPATFDSEGRVIHCSCCPDAVVKNGALVPLCICDRIENTGDAGAGLNIIRPRD